MKTRRTSTTKILATFAFVIAAFCGTGAAQEGGNPFAPEKAPPLPEGMKGSSVNDPRFSLSAGAYDAAEFSFGIKHINLFRKPAAFDMGVDPNDPRVAKALLTLGIPENAVPPSMKMPLAGLALANTDIAFQGNHLFLGNYYGINIYNIADPAKAQLVTSMLCPGGQGDVSVYKNLMFMSVEAPNGRIDCGTQAFPLQTAPGLPSAQKDRFRGVRIFDISDIKNPKQVAAVQSCRGSHTHTLVEDPKDRNNVYIYISGISFVRSSEELAGCTDGDPEKTPNTARFSIDIIKVPVASPQNAKIIASPRIFGDDKGKINALNDGGSHESKGRPRETDQCHDITVYSELGLAAGACSGNGILLDIKDPANPKRIDAVNDKNYAYWHSASFSNDGKKVVFTDEWGGGMGARCRATDPTVWGANAIFKLDNGKLTFANYYKLPAAQGDTENCVAHNGSLVPVPGRDIKVQAWYQGGISIMDFTDPANPMEIAAFDRGPIDPNMLLLGGSWSAYWYNGNIYSSEIARGLDVFELTPTRYLSQNEIDAAKSVHATQLNVQSQEKIEWSRKLVVAKAYLDQLERSQSLSANDIVFTRQAIQKAEGSKKEADKLKDVAVSLEKNSMKTDADSARLRGLVEVLKQPTL